MIPSPERSPMRFDLDHSKLTRRVMPEARPCPICRFFNQAPRHRVAVHIPQLLDALLFAMHVEVVIPPLPEPNLPALLQFARCLLFQHLNRNRQQRPVRLPDQQVNVLRHQNIPGHHEAIPSAHCFKFMFEDAVGSLTRQQRQPAITTEGQKVKTSALLVTDKFRHDERILHPILRSSFAVTHPSAKNAEGWGTHLCGKVQISKNLGCATRRKIGHPADCGPR